MKSIITTLGIALIVIGIGIFAYQKISYTKEEKVAQVNIAQVGNFSLTTEQQKTVNFPPMLGGASIAAGIALFVVGRRIRKTQ